MMNAAAESVTVYITYQGTPETRFDRDYYVRHHLSLVMRSYQPHGLESASAFFPALAESGTIAICELRFRDEGAVTAALSSAEVPTVMADVARYTDAKPNRSRAGAF